MSKKDRFLFPVIGILAGVFIYAFFYCGIAGEFVRTTHAAPIICPVRDAYTVTTQADGVKDTESHRMIYVYCDYHAAGAPVSRWDAGMADVGYGSGWEHRRNFDDDANALSVKKGDRFLCTVTWTTPGLPFVLFDLFDHDDGSNIKDCHWVARH